jgi:hypothetical protein
VDGDDCGGADVTIDHPALTRVREAIDGIDDPAEALETLCQRGVLPSSFVGDPTRWFFCAKCARAGWQCDAPVACVCEGGGEVPATLADLVAWASLGAPAIERAEDLAREAVARLAPWGVARGPRQVVWRVGEPSARGAIGWPYRDVDPTVGVERFVAGHKQTLRDGDPHATTAALVRVWPEDAPPCPYAPLLDLLRTGVALDAITDRALVLVVPPLA